MNIIYTSILYLCMATGSVVAGDGASGPIPYSIDLSQPFTVYEMSSHDNGRSASLVKKLNYKGAVAHSVRTTLSLKIDKKTVRGAVYQAIEKPDYFYVINGDAMLKLHTRWAYNPAAGGFSMHAPPSRNFIVCLNLDGGVPFLSSSPVKEGKVTWKGHDWDRLKE